MDHGLARFGSQYIAAIYWLASLRKGLPVPLRPKTLELAILGRLMQGPCHGYVLRKHLVAVVGALHSVSYGSLYPALRRLTERGLICDCGAGLARFVGGRSRRVYHITELGQERLMQELAEADSASWADDDFGVRFSLLGSTAATTRIDILRGRREHSETRLTNLLASVQADFDRYTTELVRHAGEMIARELEWLDQLIAAEEAADHGAAIIKENK